MATATSDKTAAIETIPCGQCGKTSVILVTQEQFKAFVSPNRPKVQDIFPELNAAERELLISGTHDACWREMFKVDDFNEELAFDLNGDIHE